MQSFREYFEATT